MADEIKCQESYDAGYEKGEKIGFKDGESDGYDRGYDDGKNEGYTDGFSDGSAKVFDNSQRDDLRFAVRAFAKGDGEQFIFNLCRALGDATEAAEVVRNEWRRL